MQILEQFDGTIEWKATERREGASPQQLSEEREHSPVTEQSEGASPQQLNKVKERHMHWNLIDGTTSGCTRSGENKARRVNL